MPHTLKVIVKPHPSSEVSGRDSKDPNVNLVYNGLPARLVGGHFSGETQEKTVQPEKVQLVVVFKMIGSKPDDAQRAFLDHLQREGVVESYAWYDSTGWEAGKSE